MGHNSIRHFAQLLGGGYVTGGWGVRVVVGMGVGIWCVDGYFLGKGVSGIGRGFQPAL